MKFPVPPHFSSLQEALTTLFGPNATITDRERILGGDSNDATALTLSDGTRIFMKSNRRENEAFFHAEAVGLSAIAENGTIRTPQILATGMDGDRSFLLLEYIDWRQRRTEYWQKFARELAAMHRMPAGSFVGGGSFGFMEDNFIGSRPQKNTPADSWIVFFRDCRLRPQYEDAARSLDRADRARFETLLRSLDRWLVEPDQPSLLHGDLWSGNVMTGNDGKAWLVDPAAYVGHREADLAMTELFGGFPQSFYDIYNAAYPLQPGYAQRRDLYNLYHLLNHLNMFGSGYRTSVLRVLTEYV